MSRSIRRLRLALPASLIALGAGTALAVPAQAASSWSPPVQLPAGCVSSGSVPGLAVNAAGVEAAAGSQLNADNSSSVLVCTSADGQTWPAPATVGQGTSPAVALAPDGRAVTAWEGGPFTAPVIQASVRPPGGTWSAPVTVGTDARGPLIGIDRSGNAIIAWMGATGAIHTASLPVGGSWTPAQTLATTNYGSGLDMAVNSAGSAVLTWAAKGTGVVGTYADSGTILGGFAAPVKVGLPPYPGGRTSVALNDAGQAVMVWARGLGAANVAATRSAAGTWSAAVQLSANEAGKLDVAIDGAGDAVATFEQYVPGTSIIALYASKLPAGGSWGPPALLSAPGDSVSNSLGGRVVADSAGTFVIAWTDGTTRTLNALTSPPGGGFGPAITLAPNVTQINGLQIAPGHAVLTFNSVVTTEPVS
jgi:hypothetical protein